MARFAHRRGLWHTDFSVLEIRAIILRSVGPAFGTGMGIGGAGCVP